MIECWAQWNIFPRCGSNVPIEAFKFSSIDQFLMSAGSRLRFGMKRPNLHGAMWQNNLEKRLLNVDKCKPLKYLPANEVKNLQLPELRCEVEAILIREEFTFTLERLEDFRPEVGGVVVMGQPGIGKSVFLYYLLLRLLSIGEPVALQRGKFFYLFSETGVKMFDGEVTRWKFPFERKLWALSDSSIRHGILPCDSFQSFSLQKRAFVVQATSPAGGRWKRWRKECGAGVFIMESFNESEAKALSIILNLDFKRFLGHFKKWGPCARTCVGLASGFLTEAELQQNATTAASKFAQDPSAVTMEAPSQDGFHVLFTVCPNDKRSDYTLRVTTPYLRSLVMEQIANFDAANQVPFYHQGSSLPQF